MSNSITHTSQNAKSGAAESFTKGETGFTLTARIVLALKEIFPKKTVQHASFVTGADERTVKFWLAGTTRMSVESVGALLRSDEGYAILAAIMGEAKPAWWVATQLAHSIRSQRAAIKKQEERTAALRAQLDLIQHEGDL